MIVHVIVISISYCINVTSCVYSCDISQLYEAEVRELSIAMGGESSSSMLAVALCRRGALLRKVVSLRASRPSELEYGLIKLYVGI